MKLVLRRRVPGDSTSPFSLYTEDGEALPGQTRIRLAQLPNALTRITVDFDVDERDVRIEGSEKGETP